MSTRAFQGFAKQTHFDYFQYLFRKRDFCIDTEYT